MTPLLTLALFIVLELISNNVMEPWLYGSSTGVTPIALIVAALVWTWLWGPAGLVMATPLTVCMVVMGRHIPRLAFLSILLSDEEALTPAENCYQRLLRTGEREEMELVDQYLKANSLGSLFETVLLRVIIAAGTDQRLGFLDSEQLQHVETGLLDILETISPDLPSEHEMDCRIGCVPTQALRDQLAGDMLVRLLWQETYPARSVPAAMTLAELTDWIRKTEAEAYFAHPYHSWERGLNENTNGLIRQYFPKGIDFTTITAAQVAEVELKLNRRPRKCLDYQNPNDIFHSTPPIALAA